MGFFGGTDAEDEGTMGGIVEGGGYGAGIGGQAGGPMGAGIGAGIGMIFGGLAGAEAGRKHQEKLDQMQKSYRALQQLQQDMYAQRMKDIDKSLSYFAPVEQRMGMQHQAFTAPGGGYSAAPQHTKIDGDERYRVLHGSKNPDDIYAASSGYYTSHGGIGQK